MAELARVRADHPDVPVVAVPLGGLPPAGPVPVPVTCYRTTASALIGRFAVPPIGIPTLY